MTLFPIARLRDGLRLYDIDNTKFAESGIRLIEHVGSYKMMPHVRKKVQSRFRYWNSENQGFVEYVLKELGGEEHTEYYMDTIQDYYRRYRYIDVSTKGLVRGLNRGIDIRGIKIGNKGKIVMADDTFALSKLPRRDEDKAFVLVHKLVYEGTEYYKGVGYDGVSGLYCMGELIRFLDRGYSIAGISRWNTGKIKVYKYLPMKADEFPDAVKGSIPQGFEYEGTDMVREEYW